MNRKLILTGIISGVFLISILSYGITSAQENVVPSWIKNTAGWWAEGVVGDSDFINSLQWLVREGIITIPQNEHAVPEKKYMIKEFKFSLWQPDNWERQAEKPDPLIGLPLNEMLESRTITQSFPTRIGVLIDEMRGLSFEEYLEENENVAEEVVGLIGGNLQVIDSGFTTIDGEQAYWQSYVVDIFGLSLKGKSVSVEHRGEVYIISYEAKEKNFDEYIDQYDEILKTFKFL